MPAQADGADAAGGAAGGAGAAGRATATSRRARAETLAGESLPNLHPQAGGDIADDGWSGAGRGDGLPATAGLGAAPGGLPDHSSPDVLPGFEPGGSDVFDHRAARETVRPSARADEIGRAHV